MKKKDILRILEGYTENEDVDLDELQEEITQKNEEQLLKRINGYSTITSQILFEKLKYLGFIEINGSQIIRDTQNIIHYVSISDNWYNSYHESELSDLYIVLVCSMDTNYDIVTIQELKDVIEDVEDDILVGCKKVYDYIRQLV